MYSPLPPVALSSIRATQMVGLNGEGPAVTTCHSRSSCGLAASGLGCTITDSEPAVGGEPACGLDLTHTYMTPSNTTTRTAISQVRQPGAAARGGAAGADADADTGGAVAAGACLGDGANA